MSESFSGRSAESAPSGLRVVDQSILFALASTFGAPHPKDDERAVDELITVALSAQDEILRWDAVAALHWHGSQEAFDRALGLCHSFCAVERKLGADILGQLGAPNRTFPRECVRLLLEILETEREPRVLRAILTALGHLHRVEAIIPAVGFRSHVDASVRDAVVHAVMGFDDPHALSALIELTRDEDPHVRDWATFALGTQVDVDTPPIRSALVERLSDDDDDARCEALVGLARRGDRRVVEPLKMALAAGSVWSLEIEAAALIGDPHLLPELVALRGCWDDDQEALEEAIRACSATCGGTAGLNSATTEV